MLGAIIRFAVDVLTGADEMPAVTATAVEVANQSSAKKEDLDIFSTRIRFTCLDVPFVRFGRPSVFSSAKSAVSTKRSFRPMQKR